MEDSFCCKQKKQSIAFLLLLFAFSVAQAQVKINEVMVRPGGNQGLIVFNSNSGNEYIELYNSGCTSVNISGYFIACRQDFAGNPSGGAFRIPNIPASVIAPGGHLVLGTSSSSADPNSIDIKLPDYTSNYCLNSISFNFILANADGWVALFDALGVPVDAVYWSSAAGNISQSSDFGGVPCVPTGSPGGVLLESAQQINSGFPGVLTYVGANPAAGATFSRIPDGGSWQGGVTPSINDLTVGNCNGGTCQPATSISFAAVPTLPTCGNSNGSVTVTVTSPGTASYAWSANANTGNSATASNLSGGTYSVTVTQNGCTKDTSITLTSSAPVTFNLSNIVSPGCGNSNGSVTITVTSPGTASYAWSPNANTGNSATAPNLSGGTYSVTITQNGCAKDTFVTLTSPNGVVLTLTNPVNPTCVGNDGGITINLSGGTAPYNVSIDTGGALINLSVPASISQSIGNLPAGTVSVFVTDGSGCTANASTILTAPANCCAFSLTANVVQAACGSANGSITVLASGGSGNYNYTWSANAATGNTATATSLSSGVYLLTVTDNSFANCFIDTSFTVSNPNAPVIDSSIVTNETCPLSGDGSIALYASGGNGNLTYTWSANANTGNLNLATNLAAGTYNYTITDATNCQVSGSAIVQSGICCNLQTLAIWSSTTCGQDNGSITVNFVNGQPPMTYSINGGTPQSSPYFDSLQAGIYVIVTTTGQNCKDTIQVTVGGSTSNLNASLQGKDVSCFGYNDGEVISTVSGANGNTTYLWNNGSTSQNIFVLNAGLYTLTVSDADGCSATASTQVSQPAALSINIGNDTTLCTLSEVNISAPVGFTSYTWSNGFSGPSISTISNGIFSVTVTDNNGCTASDALSIQLSSAINLDLGGDTIIFEGSSIEFYPTFSGSTIGNFFWSPSENVSCADCQNTIASPAVTTLYTLVFIDNNNCLVSDSVLVTVLSVGDVVFPTAFSPNGDGKNDVYKAVSNGVKSLRLTIFNRWGELVFESDNINEGWNGIYKGDIQPLDVYVYTSEVTFMNNFKRNYIGSISLIR
jgi:gliding motility-associated-like protein